MMTHLNAQPLIHHQWEDRLVLILSDSESNPAYTNQIAEFLADEKGMKERRLIVYHIFEQQHQTGLSSRSDWVISSNLFQHYNTSNADFEVILIGLDGGIKLRQSKLLTLYQLFATIDVMPMRRAELRKKKN